MLQEMLGDVLAVVDPAESLAALTKAMKLRRERAHAGADGPSARLMNNTAVLEYRSKQVDTALELMQEASVAVETGAAFTCVGHLCRSDPQQMTPSCV